MTLKLIFRPKLYLPIYSSVTFLNASKFPDNFANTVLYSFKVRNTVPIDLCNQIQNFVLFVRSVGMWNQNVTRRIRFNKVIAMLAFRVKVDIRMSKGREYSYNIIPLSQATSRLSIIIIYVLRCQLSQRLNDSLGDKFVLMITFQTCQCVCLRNYKLYI